MIPLDEVVEFQKLTTKEKISSLIEIRGHAHVVKDVIPLGKSSGKDVWKAASKAQEALASSFRKKKYSVLRFSAILSIVLLTSLFILTEIIPNYLANLGFWWMTLIWIISIVIFTLAGWYVLNKGFKELDAIFFRRLNFENEERIKSENRLKKIIILEKELRDTQKDEVDKWLDEIFDRKKREVLEQINRDLIKIKYPPIDNYNFDDVENIRRVAKEDPIYFLMVHRPIDKILQIFPKEIVKKVKSKKFKRESMIPF